MTVTSTSPVDHLVRRRTYVACLHCGEELAYNWQKMRIEGPCRELPLPSPTLVSIAHGFRNMRKMLAPQNMSITNVQVGHGGWIVLESTGTRSPGAAVASISKPAGTQPAINQLAAK
jgi:hypothetical protein